MKRERARAAEEGERRNVGLERSDMKEVKTEVLREGPMRKGKRRKGALRQVGSEKGERGRQRSKGKWGTREQ